MGSFDKFQAVEELKSKGWTEDLAAGEYMLRPPKELLDRLALLPLHVYDARDLQTLAEPSPVNSAR